MCSGLNSWSSQPTYEELKRELARGVSKVLDGSQPTYEELKHFVPGCPGIAYPRSQPTYEELKQYINMLFLRANKSSQPTYEELKHESYRPGVVSALVLSLPMRIETYIPNCYS